MAGAQRLVLKLTGWLCGKQLAAERITLRLEHERGRKARPATVVEVAFSEPVWQGEYIVRLLKEQLGKVELVAPVIQLALEVSQLQPMAPPSESLFVDPGGTQEDHARMVDLLVARLGAENVLQPLPVADYRPEVANVWVPIQQKVREADVAAKLPPGLKMHMWPTWLLAKPIALLIREHRPFYGSPLQIVSRPDRVEAGWWSDAASRDYFIAEGQDHTLYYVYRERISSESEAGNPKWFLHGLFG
jgi:protein ImuB